MAFRRASSIRRDPEAASRKSLRNWRKNVCVQSTLGFMSSQDSFGESFTMKLESDSDELKTVMGSLCSILLLCITLFYAYLKFDVLMYKKDIKILRTVHDLFFTDDDKFSYAEGMNIAVALTAYDSVTEPILDPTIGELFLNHYTWGYDADG